MMASPPRWMDRAARVLAPLDRAFDRLYGSRYNPLYQSGALAVGLFLVMLVTGLYLLWFYQTGRPYESVQDLHGQIWAGRWIRGLHRYSADLAVVAIVAHMLRMFLQGKSWGPRTLAWITGLILLGIVMLCGWTGMVLVWDELGQAVAVEGAKLLDLLPLFSEPMSRTFARPEGPSSGFFFLNLFAHIALPLGIALFVWIHTMRVARATLLPPRRLWWSTVGVLIVFAMWVPPPLARPADVLALPGEMPLDVFYAYWVPVSQRVPAWVHLLLWTSLFVTMGSVPLWWRPRTKTRLMPSMLDETRCTGCTQCSLDCPYEAIAMVPRTDGAGSEIVAHVNPALCVSCGLCAGSCAPMEIGPPMRNGKAQLRRVQAFHEREAVPAGSVVVISCQQGVGQHPAIAALTGTAVYPVECVGSVHTSIVEYLIRRGVTGVYFAACPDRDCMFREGPKWLRERLYAGREAELHDRVDARRVRVGSFGFGHGFAASVDVRAFQEELNAIATGAHDEGHVEIEPECETDTPVEPEPAKVGHA